LKELKFIGSGSGKRKTGKKPHSFLTEDNLSFIQFAGNALMQILSKLKQHSDTIVKLLPLLAFVAPMTLLYVLNPADPYLNLSPQDSFQLMWKGRTFQLFFAWLITLEFILSWEIFKSKISKQNKSKLVAFAIALVLPTAYVISEYYFGLNAAIANFSLQNGVAFYDSMPLAIEYLVFASLFCLIIFLSFGKKGLSGFALPAFFVGLVGVLYTIDNVFPDGQFTPFQILVPSTATLAARVLGLMGYTTLLGTENSMPTLQATGPLGTAKFAIAWPCAGIESFLIFTAVVLVFLQQMPISWKAKTGYFIFGAAVTYFINVMRIVTIFTIGMQYGVNSDQVQTFHFYYGPLYAIAWIVSYPLVIIASQSLWRKIKNGPTALTTKTLGNLNKHS
jgi:thaumarchaeosortase